jgi:hypothetical protein
VYADFDIASSFRSPSDAVLRIAIAMLVGTISIGVWMNAYPGQAHTRVYEYYDPTTQSPSLYTSEANAGDWVGATFMNSPQLRVYNPKPGMSFHSGTHVDVTGIAVDPAAMSMASAAPFGIDEVQVFLDNPDDAGVFLANATMTSGTNTWLATISLPADNTGPHALWIYARSSVTGKQTASSIPVVIDN